MREGSMQQRKYNKDMKQVTCLVLDAKPLAKEELPERQGGSEKNDDIHSKGKSEAYSRTMGCT